MLLGLEKTKNQVEIYNIGSEDQTNVKTIAEIVAEEMGFQNVEFKFTGGVDGGRGWKGDVKNAPRHKQTQRLRMETQTQQQRSRKKSNQTLEN
jgi:nucleoside-diphosphate-sugar epimerase